MNKSIIELGICVRTVSVTSRTCVVGLHAHCRSRLETHCFESLHDCLINRMLRTFVRHCCCLYSGRMSAECRIAVPVFVVATEVRSSCYCSCFRRIAAGSVRTRTLDDSPLVAADSWSAQMEGAFLSFAFVGGIN